MPLRRPPLLAVGAAACALAAFAATAVVEAQTTSPAPAPSASPVMSPPPSPSAAPHVGGRYGVAVAAIAGAASEFMRRQHAPGMVLALTDARGTIAVLPFGDADIDKHVPVTARTRFGIGSITKSMTAIGLLQARDRGRFDPHAPVTRYVPWFSVRSRYRPITGHDLLTHTSGLPAGVLAAGEPYDVAMLRDVETAFAPGTHWSYSNLGYETLGTIVAAIDGAPWNTIVERDVFARLGMRHSASARTYDTLATAATGYLPREDDRLHDPRAWPMAAVPLMQFTDPGGSVLSTGGDMAIYARALLRGGVGDDGRRLLSPASFALLTTAAATADGVPSLYEKYAYGLAVHRQRGDVIIGHTGGSAAYTACMEIDLTAGFAAVALTNVGDLADRPCGVVEHALLTLRAAARGDALPALPAADDPARVAHAARYAGTYRDETGETLRIVATAPEQLAVRASDGTPHPLLDAGNGTYWTDLAPYRRDGIRFLVDASHGTVTEIVARGRWYASGAYRGPRTFRHPAAWDALTGSYRYPGAHPYDASLRVMIVKDRLVLDDGTPLVPLANGAFRMGADTWSPERVRFDSVINGRAQRALVDAVALYRTPFR